MTDTQISRADHLAWCKERALEYLDNPAAGNEQSQASMALSSFWSDLRKHPDTEDHAALELGAMLAFNGHLSTVRQVREFIEGCN